MSEFVAAKFYFIYLQANYFQKKAAVKCIWMLLKGVLWQKLP